MNLLNAIFASMQTTSARAALDQLYTSYMLDKRMVDLSAAVPYLVESLMTVKPEDFCDMIIRQPGTHNTFRITRCIGAGLSAFVFQATTSDGQNVAMKIYNKIQMYKVQSVRARNFVETELAAFKRVTKDGSPYLTKVLAAWSDLCFVYVVTVRISTISQATCY